jgi:anti-sigma factor RsiW
MSENARLSDQERSELVAYLDGELDADEARRWEEKLRADPRLRLEADELQRTWQLLDHLPAARPLSAAVSRTLMQLAASEPRRSPKLRVSLSAASWAWIVALLALAGLGYLLAPAPRHVHDLDRDPVFQSEPRLIENLPLYLAVENFEYLQSLDTNDLFGEDAPGR